MQKREASRASVNAIDIAAGIRTAILVDGAFFLKRYTKLYPDARKHDGRRIAENFYKMVHKHVEGRSLYRILYYDCLPLTKRAHQPISKTSILFGETNQAVIRLAFIEELKRLRKVAIRLGTLKDHDGWVLRPEQTKSLIQHKLSPDDLKDSDFYYNVKQKGVDIRIGLDIASLAYKKLVQQIVLISGDSDFVPAAKVARREGIDFILDPMWQRVDPSLFEHIDGMKSFCPKPKNTSS